MTSTPNIEALRSSWTKYDSVKVIEATIAGELGRYISGEIGIDEPVLRNFLGVKNLQEKLPEFWNQIYNYPDQVALFALVAAIFTHYENIRLFSEQFNNNNMSGVLIMEEGKHFTNLRSALVESGASDKIFRRKHEVPYDLSKLYQSGEVGILVKELLKNRLLIIGYPQPEIDDHFLFICIQLGFHLVFGLTEDQFSKWTMGEGVSNSLYELQKNGITYEKYGRIKALKVRQWLADWDNVQKIGQKNRRKPEPFFYQFNMPALLLKRIYDIHSRRAFVGRKDEPYSQRKHSEQRSNEIREYVKGGFPWSTVSLQQRESDAYKNLQMPGWLPTSIIANILSPQTKRRELEIEADSVIKIEQIDDNFAEIILPGKIWSEKWTPLVSPIEIIDGQHRIKAFDNITEINGQFDFPILAFHDLDFTWQAYLFYTINIKPKRINTSLAYDLMPLLRIQDWLEQDLSGPDIYKKVRAQELTELLWSCRISPWNNRINMLGDTGDSKGGPVSQNAFINSLTTSFVKKWDGRIGGLFGGELHQGEEDVIQWDKETQSAYLILIWRAINHAIGKSKAEWVLDLKSRGITSETKTNNNELQIPFIHNLSFFTTDQGVRPVLFIFNDMSFESNDFLELTKFYPAIDYEKYTTDDVIELIVQEFRDNSGINSFITSIATEIVNNFDWRTPSAFTNILDAQEDSKRQHQNQFRGSGGYKEMRVQLLRILAASSIEIENNGKSIKLTDIAKNVQTKLGL